MTVINRRWQRRARVIASGASVVIASMLAVTVSGGVDHAAALSQSGVVKIVAAPSSTNPGVALAGGGSATEFSMVPPAGASCAGGGSDGYRWQTFMVDASVDPSTLTYADGPHTTGTAFVSAMYDSVGGTAVVDKNPSANPVGLISGIPTVSFGAFPLNFVPVGTYTVGFACSKAGTTLSFWTAQITTVAAAADTPAGFTWTVTQPAPPTSTPDTPASTPATPAPTPATTARSTAQASTSSTAAPTTTTTAPETTTTTTVPAATTTSIAATTTTARVASSPAVPNTGTSTLPIIVWAIVALVLGRIVILFARRVHVRPPGAR